ncbi:MAG: hypothetical protein V1874_15920 [Spirochaetota bacterium]
MKPDEIEKIEKRARALLLNKDIQPDKMDIVYSLIRNNSLSREEKYSAVIDIIKLCPDKKPQKKTEIKTEPRNINALTIAASGRHVNELYQKYKLLKLFKKRYLIHSNNRLGIGIQKRLIPGKRLLKALREIVSLQEKILSRLPDILMAILRDENIDDATHFNYLRIFRRWMMETPIIKYDSYEIKWMTPAHIESELQSYITNFFSFLKLDIETKEQILLAVENKLRQMDDLKKEEINSEFPTGNENEKIKHNLEKEKIIYDYMMTMRSFLQSNFQSSGNNNIISVYLKTNLGIDSLSEFLLILSEALIFQKQIELKDLLNHYDIKAHCVSSENWDYSSELLKEIGKDPESRIKRHLQRLKNELIPYDELYSFLKLRIEGQVVLQNAFETQWKIADKKQKDYNYIYNEDFLTFIDVCINYFNNSFVPLLNGSTIIFRDKNEAFIEGNIFSSSVFSWELTHIANLINELYYYKTVNSNITVSREEARKILQGKVRSMFEVERFISLTGEIFNQIAEKIHTLYDQHRLWILNNSRLENPNILYTPLKEIPDTNAPIPFYKCVITEFKDKRSLTDRQTGNAILADSTRSGLIITLCAFCYQLAYECLNDAVFAKLESRKTILKKLKGIGG